MQAEIRSFEDVAHVKSVARYSRAERAGLLAGDMIIAFGPHPPKLVQEAPESLETLKADDLIAVIRNDVYFRLVYGDGLEGAEIEAGPAAENIPVPPGVDWPKYWAGAQTGGGFILVPERISWAWSLFPPLLYTRYRQWLMFTATGLTWAVGFLAGGPVVFALAYIATVLLPMSLGASLLQEAAMKQGYVARGVYALASSAHAASLEVATTQALRQARTPQKSPPAH
jgi:hypothetical protein